jgi:MFS family permease
MTKPTTPASEVAATASNAWRVLLILFLINLLNFFDRTIPAVVFEPIRLEFDLGDAQLGLLSAAFTLVYALAGIPLGRLADTWSRKKILSGGVAIWSALTAATGAAWNYTSLLLIRVGVGVGEASCAPAATSLIGDLYPAHKRARAMGIYMLGLPLGLMLAFFGVGAIVQAFDNNWRAPFFIAAVPGLILAVFVLFIREPKRGAAESVAVDTRPVEKPFKKIMSIKTIWWIIISGIMVQMAGYSGNAFMVALLQRYFELPIGTAAAYTGVIVGVTGLFALTLGAQISDYLHQRSPTGRLNYGAISLFGAAVATFIALEVDASQLTLFSVCFGIGWLLYYNYFTTIYPALQDVVEPRLRATAMAVYFAGQYLLGGAIGPVLAGWLSDRFSESAMTAAGASEMTEQFKAIGLHDALYIVPVTLLLTGFFVFLAGRSYVKDHQAMIDGMKGANAS